MGQVTSATIKMIRDHIARGEHPPLTLHEINQLATAWESGQPAASAEPWCWAIDGSGRMWRGPFAEAEARREAAHVGGTGGAFPLFRHPPVAQEPVCTVENDYNADGKSARIDTYLPAGTKLYAAPVAAQAQRHEFDDCAASPTGKHSESWFANGDCEYCKAGAQPDAPLFYARAQP